MSDTTKAVDVVREAESFVSTALGEVTKACNATPMVGLGQIVQSLQFSVEAMKAFLASTRTLRVELKLDGDHHETVAANTKLPNGDCLTLLVGLQEVSLTAVVQPGWTGSCAMQDWFPCGGNGVVAKDIATAWKAGVVRMDIDVNSLIEECNAAACSLGEQIANGGRAVQDAVDGDGSDQLVSVGGEVRSLETLLGQLMGVEKLHSVLSKAS